MNDAERLKEIADMPELDRAYLRYIKSFEMANLQGIRKAPFDKMKRSFFEHMVAGHGEKVDDILINEMYTGQDKLLEKFKENGFKVTEEATSNIITLNSTANDEMEAREREFNTRFREARYTIEW